MIRWFGRLLAALRGRRPPLIGTLADERKGKFFSWFHLEERKAVSAEADGRSWHYYRPQGSTFQTLVKLDVLTSSDDQIVGARLSLDRSFIDDRRNAAFARDIAKSFLTWSLCNEPDKGAHALIANIADLGASGSPVIMRASAAPPPLPPDTSGGYAVFLGRRDQATLALSRVRLILRNVALANGSSGQHWLTIEVGALHA
jgi:hypothetical protein